MPQGRFLSAGAWQKCVLCRPECEGSHSILYPFVLVGIKAKNDAKIDTYIVLAYASGLEISWLTVPIRCVTGSASQNETDEQHFDSLSCSSVQYLKARHDEKHCDRKTWYPTPIVWY